LQKAQKWAIRPTQENESLRYAQDDMTRNLLRLLLDDATGDAVARVSCRIGLQVVGFGVDTPEARCAPARAMRFFFSSGA
jgi:hypothetical protein